MTIDNTEYAVKFRRTKSTTTCVILAGTPDSRDSEKNVVAEGTVRRFSGDNENRVIGRTYALDRASEKLSVGKAIFDQTNIRKKWFDSDVPTMVAKGA